MVEVVKPERLKRSRSKIHKSRTAESPRFPLIENREVVDNILSVFGNDIETQIFAVAGSGRDIGRVGPSTATPAFVGTSARQAAP